MTIDNHERDVLLKRGETLLANLQAGRQAGAAAIVQDLMAYIKAINSDLTITVGSDPNVLFASAAISLKRIADAMQAPSYEFFAYGWFDKKGHMVGFQSARSDEEAQALPGLDGPHPLYR